MSRFLLDSIKPVDPPSVNKIKNPVTHIIRGSFYIGIPDIDINHENTLTPVGILIIIVDVINYNLVSTSIPVVYIWWLHTNNPIIPMVTML